MMIPIELYAHILSFVPSSSLVPLSCVSREWRILAEGKLWHSACVVYDDPSPANVDLLNYLSHHAGVYVRHLEIDYSGSGSGSNCCDDDEQGGGASRGGAEEFAERAVGSMSNLDEVNVYGAGDVPGEMLSHFCTCKDRIRTVKYAGPASTPLFTFLQHPQVTNLQILVLSNNLEPRADYSLLRQPWKALTTFSGNILHSAAILRSCSATIRDVTVHLNPSIMSLKNGWGDADLPILENVRCFGVGDLNGYPPVYIDHVLGDMVEAMGYFPCLEELKRVPFHERINKTKLLQLLESAPHLRYVSLLDYNTDIRPARGKELALELGTGVCCHVGKVVVCPCPNQGNAVVHEREEEPQQQPEQQRVVEGGWVSHTINVDVDDIL